MIQEILTIFIVAGAFAYVVYFVVKNTVGKKDKCEGCAVNKLYQMKLERERSRQ